jgi:hypothetical protein
LRAVFITLVAVALPFVLGATEEGCKVNGRKYPDGARIESHLVTGVRSRTAVPVYVVCRDKIWVWPSTGDAVIRVH